MSVDESKLSSESSFPHVCIERLLPEQFQATAAAAAYAENPANSHANALEAAVIDGKLWKPGRTLKIRFLDGIPSVQAKVRDIAMQWTKIANIHFDFGDHADAEIRISFLQPGSWSALGTDALNKGYFPADQPTMNYGWLTLQTSQEEYDRVVLHEFGHALGMPHEHQQPAADIQWDKARVYADLGGPPNNWDKATINANMFYKYSRETTAFTAFDPKSIMLYSFPAEWTLTHESFDSNSQISSTDRAFIQSRYPQSKK